MASSTRKILVAVDESENSKRAFHYYLEHIARGNDEVILVHMFNPPPPPTMSLRHPSAEPWKEWRAKVDQTLEELKGLLRRYEAECDAHKLARRAVLHSGGVGEGVCKLASDNSVVMIVMGTRGLNFVRRTFLGSSSDYVLHHSRVPVVVVPLPEDRQPSN